MLDNDEGSTAYTQSRRPRNASRGKDNVEDIVVVRLTTVENVQNSKSGCFAKFNRWIYLAIAVLVVVICVSLTFIIICSKSGGSTADSAIKTNISNASLPNEHFKLITKEEWLAQPSDETDMLVTPVPKVIILHTATENCTDQTSCTFQVRTLQIYHIEARHWSDIAYNFLVGGNGAIYEGRGWYTVGAHTKGHNADSIGIAFIGTFNNIKPSERQLNAALSLISKGVELGKIAKDYKLFGQRQLGASLSPGDVLFNIIKTWPHFSEEL